MNSESLLGQLVEALRCLPGVGPKSAQRMALHLLERDRDGGLHLSTVLQDAMERIGRCRVCRDLTENEVCRICANERRDQSLLCIVESPSDVMAIENATGYQGRYFVLLGRLSPLDGIGPAELGLEELAVRLRDHPPGEMIIATNPTVEGEATAFYLQRMAQKYDIAISRIAHGVPLGGELEYTDQSTIAHAFASRQEV
jgi:recombination protein RecR